MKQRVSLAALALLLLLLQHQPAPLGKSLSAQAPNQKAAKSPNTSQDAKKGGASAPQSPDRVRLRSRIVSLTVTVSNTNGRIISGLTKDKFEVYDDGVKQEIACRGGSPWPPQTENVS